jgi:periplasmic serine protease, Do/DeqQ family
MGKIRKIALVVGVALLLMGILYASPHSVKPVPPAVSQDVFSGNPVAAIAKKSSPAVVNIDTKTMVRQSFSPFGNDPFFRQFFGDEMDRFSRVVPMEGKGSGFIASSDGMILTNSHVVDGADSVTVTLSDGRRFDAEVVGKDPTYDLAVIRIKASNLPVLKMGDSDRTQVGEWVVAIGNPFGLEHTVTVGVISAKNRSIRLEKLNFDGFFQTDAAINPGNSGGPLINLDNQVIGINTAIVPYAQGIGFAIPINVAKQVMNDLVKFGRVKRAWLGVYMQPVTADIIEAFGLKSGDGALVSDVMPNSPAEKAGIQRGDVIKRFQGVPVKTPDELSKAVRKQVAGDVAKIEIVREGKTMSLSIRLEELPDQEPAKKNGTPNLALQLGVEVGNLDAKTRQQFDLPVLQGVVILRVEGSSPAERAGLRPGDVIQGVNGRSIRDVRSWETTLKAAGAKKIVLLVWRGGADGPLSAQ